MASDNSTSLALSSPADAPSTMSSLEMVAFINADREQQARAAGVDFPSKGFAKLRHDTLMAKVPQVLGEESAQNFLDCYVGENGKQSPCYRLPKREACLMAMSYSYELQAKVFDRMTALETAALPAPEPVAVLPAPNPLAEQAAGIATQALVQLHEATATHAAQMSELLSQQARLIALIEQRPVAHSLPAALLAPPAPARKDNVDRMTVAAWLDRNGHTKVNEDWALKQRIIRAVRADYERHGKPFALTRGGFGLFSADRIKANALPILEENKQPRLPGY